MSKLKDILIKELEQGNISDVFELIEENISNKNISIKDMFLLNNLKNEFIFSGGNHTFHSRLLTFIQQNITDTIMAKSTKETPEKNNFVSGNIRFALPVGALIVIIGLVLKYCDVPDNTSIEKNNPAQETKVSEPQNTTITPENSNKFMLVAKITDTNNNILEGIKIVITSEGNTFAEDETKLGGILIIKNVNLPMTKIIELAIERNNSLGLATRIDLSTYQPDKNNRIDLGVVKLKDIKKK